jgi:hypothetical protein
MTNSTKTYRDTTFAKALGNYKVPAKRQEESKPYTGKAYAFFNAYASKSQIEAELPLIRQLARTPKNLELTLIEGVEDLRGDKQIRDIAKEAKDCGIRYVIQARCPKKDNKETADEIAAVLNQAYQSPLYSKDEDFYGKILYRKNSQYRERE